MFSARALWPLCLQHFSIPFTLHNPHYPFFVSPRLSMCLSQLPVSLILNPVEIGQAEWASFDQALISGVLTVSAHPDPTEPWSPRGELQTGIHPLTLLERKGKVKLQSSCLNCQLQILSPASLFSIQQTSRFNTIYLWRHLLLLDLAFYTWAILAVGKEINSQCNAIWGSVHSTEMWTSLLLLSAVSLIVIMESVSLVFEYCVPRPGMIPAWVGGMSQKLWWSCGTNASCRKMI